MNAALRSAKDRVERIFRERKDALFVLFCMLATAGLAYAVLWPASRDWIFHGPQTQTIGDGSDLRGLAWQNRIILRTLLEHPSRLFYGAIFTELRDAPTGGAMWTAWVERIIVPPLYLVANDASMGAAMAFVLMLMNAAAALFFARVMRFPMLVQLLVCLVFAINPYTRARAAVHTALVGTYAFPLVFGALELLSRLDPRDPKQRRKTLLTAAVAFFLAATAAHYYVIVLIVCSPVLALFFFMRLRSSYEPRGFYARRTGYALLATIPAFALLAWSYKVPLPPEATRGPAISVYPEADKKRNLMYLHDVGAHPIDYVGNDVKFGPADVIPKRAEITQWIRTHMDSSHPQERSNGIRWSVLALCVVVLLTAFWKRPKTADDRRSRQLLVLAMVLAAWAFVFSLSPRGLVVYGEEYGPSLFANELIPNFRVPSRFGPLVLLASLLFVGEYLSHLTRREHRSWSQGIGTALASVVLVGSFVEYIPRSTMQMAAFRPALTELVRKDGTCGMGIFLPFGAFDYWAYEETRGTACALVYPTDETRATKLGSELGYGYDFSSPTGAEKFVKLAQCMGMDWVSFRGNVPPRAREDICNRLGWEETGPLTCRSPNVAPVKRTLEQCGF